MAPNEVITREEDEFDDSKPEHLLSPGNETYDEDGVKLYKLTTDPDYKHSIIYPLAITFTLLHIAALYGLYLIVTLRIKLLSFLWALFLSFLSGQGVVIGAHRGYSHNSFKLNTFGEVFIILCQTISGQNSIYWWARDHRIHHKFVDTDADPYNAQRGFFFSHIGWLMTRKHPLVQEKGKVIDMSDLEANKLIMFQKEHFVAMFTAFGIFIPFLVPIIFWNEDFIVSVFTCFAFRYVYVLNTTWTINSFAHLYGFRPFDKRISARQSKICNMVTFGDGWHNYHHVFPWDHAISEYGYKGGIATNFLHFLHWLGIASDLKTASSHTVYKHSVRHGDGTVKESDFNFEK